MTDGRPSGAPAGKAYSHNGRRVSARYWSGKLDQIEVDAVIDFIGDIFEDQELVPAFRWDDNGTGAMGIWDYDATKVAWVPVPPGSWIIEGGPDDLMVAEADEITVVDEGRFCSADQLDCETTGNHYHCGGCSGVTGQTGHWVGGAEGGLSCES